MTPTRSLHRISPGIRRATLIVGAAIGLASTPGRSEGQWPQFGGARQDFKVECKGLAEEWPDDGPKKLWNRELGDGYSGIIVDGNVLYTMYRTKEDKEAVIALDASTGKTIWEYAYDCPVREGHVKEFGTGPRATPTLDGDRLYTAGVSGHLHCLDKKSGKALWSHDLWKEYEGTFLNHGFSTSPFIYKETVVMLVGGKGHAIVAFDKKDGKELWKKHDFGNSYATPKLINVDGEDQLACPMAAEVVGICAATGELRWSVEQKNQWGQNICQPTYDGKDHMLFISSVEPACSKGIRLTRSGEDTTAEEVWTNRKVRVHHSNAIRVDDCVFTSTGGDGPGLYFAVDAKTGDMKWRKRGFAKATSLYADGKFLVLDEDGKLGLVRATPEKFEILAQAKVLESQAWTVPTLVGTKGYLRDRKNIMSIELGRDAYASAANGGKGKRG